MCMLYNEIFDGNCAIILADESVRSVLHKLM